MLDDLNLVVFPGELPFDPRVISIWAVVGLNVELVESFLVFDRSDAVVVRVVVELWLRFWVWVELAGVVWTTLILPPFVVWPNLGQVLRVDPILGSHWALLVVCEQVVRPKVHRLVYA